MTSKNDALRTNEFLRRRKLRLQQVREQSKEIAKKIRQRAKVEKLRRLEDINVNKEKEYFDCQEKLVKHLEHLYSERLQNVGASHKNALETTQDITQTIDISKLRGIEATAELRRKKQETLDKQKKLLERKLQARVVANEISREKSVTVAKSLAKQGSKKSQDLLSKPVNTIDIVSNTNINPNKDINNPDATKNDMGTQWESVELPNEWAPNIPTLSLPKDDNVKDNMEKIDKTKRLNLFALSDEMPSSLRGGLTGIIDDTVTNKPSLSIVSEYLQNRNLRLRQPEPNSSKKADDLQSIKQTILRTRATRTDGNVFDNVCHVLDEQIIPVPSWQAEGNPGLCLCQHYYYRNLLKKSIFRAPINKLPDSPRFLQRNLQSSPLLKDVYLRAAKPRCGKCKHIGRKDKSFQSTESNLGINRKQSISMYNHNTKNMQDIPCVNDKLVSRDDKSEEDAYAQALKETTLASRVGKDQNKLQKDMRTKVAISRNNVDKEYRDTLTFLNSLTKDKNKPIKTAYMDDNQQLLQNERRQKKLQEEFKRIEKQCCKSKDKNTILEKRSKSKSPLLREQHQENFEYSWMPVPECDGNLAIHTVPNTRNKSANTVKFSESDSYHEYRSKHKHTPPTKDVSNDRQKRRIVETVILQHANNDSDVNESTVTSETSSFGNFDFEANKTNDKSELQDAERIIIYKILDSRKENKNKERKKVSDQKTTMYTSEAKTQVKQSVENKHHQNRNLEKSTGGDIQRGISYEQLQEGVYEAVNNDGDNVTSMYFNENVQKPNDRHPSKKCNMETVCCCSKKEETQNHCGNTTERLLKQALSCTCKCRSNECSQPSAATSTTSFTTACNEKTSKRAPKGPVIKLTDEDGQENSKFYIGASGFLKDDNYEVVIQLRKKETEKDNIDTKQVTQNNSPVKSIDPEIQNKAQNVPDSTVTIAKANTPLTSPTNIATNEEAFVALHDFNRSNEQVENKTSEIEINPTPKPSEANFKKFCEKSVLTSFQDSFAIPVNVPKSEAVSRPATSAYTQTSFNSTTPKPAFMHMSSSTSTAYMSPPELILPKFLKHNYIINNEAYESVNTSNHLECNFEVMEAENCTEFTDCTCRLCYRNKLPTPPNTARSCSNEQSNIDYVKKNKLKHKCHKCRSHSETNIYHKAHKKKSHKTQKTQSSRDLPSDYFNRTVKQSVKNDITKPRSNIKARNMKLNPIVKNYVNKLLDINSEGLKAIKIINQDCSTAATPSSSIINLPCNRNKCESTAEKKISLEQIKNILEQQIIDNMLHKEMSKKATLKSKESQTDKISLKLPKKKSVHKVKSLNISKQILKKNKPSDSLIRYPQRLVKYAESVSVSVTNENKLLRASKLDRSRGKISATPVTYDNSEYKNSTSSDVAETVSHVPNRMASGKNMKVFRHKTVQRNKNISLPSHKATRTSFSSDSDATAGIISHLPTSSLHISTQTNSIIDPEINFMKVAEDKLQNMEKIATLTEKCTKRLSNLAKVLEEVRKNKSLVYSQISTSDSTPDSELKGPRNEPSSDISEHNINSIQNIETIQNLSSLSMPDKMDEKHVHARHTAEFMPFLKDIPKPQNLTSQSAPYCNFNNKASKSTKTCIESDKSRARPPPALSRIHLKSGQDVNIIPHELSTVIEVDSPMSMRVKNQTSRQDTKIDTPEESDHICNEIEKRISIIDDLPTSEENQVDPDLLQSNINSSKRLSKVSSADSTDNSKARMMDMKKFNDIMLKPFITLKEYAHQCNIGLQEASNSDDVKGEAINDDLSSLHSDGSLPDVVAELLKRNIISEPFKFDTVSNANSTTLSSESTLSILALSRARKEKKKSSVLLKKKEHVETSGTLSMSSNPDLENAFQKLGMGWASSTLKKTKERLALSSSSNTSSSSMTQFKIRSFTQDVPNIATDSTSSLLDVSKKRERQRSPPGRYNTEENSKDVVQQTSITNSMTVKEFLTNELAKKITFNNKSSRKETEEEFISLFETKIPEDMKVTNTRNEDDQSSVASDNRNRARTSTPVQIFKSQTYHSSSTSNTSNGFFSNADDLSSVKVTSTSIRNHSTSDKDDLTIPNYSLKTKKGLSDCSKSD